MPSWKVAVQGTHAAGDVWQFGFAAQTTEGDGPSIAAFVADAAATLLFSGTGCPFPEAVTVRGARVWALDELTGTLLFAAEAAHVQAGAITNSLPPEVAVCVSLTTNANVRGRMYLPPLGTNQTDPNGYLDPGAQDWLRDHVESFFQSMRDATPAIGPAVYSPRLQVSALINGGNIGSVFDSQRRRRNKLVEARSSFAVT